jgi:hypothetical protein
LGKQWTEKEENEMPGAAVAKHPTPQPVEVRESIPVLSDADLAREIVSRLSMYLPDAENHRAECRRVVEESLRSYRHFGCSPSFGTRGR